MRTLSALEVLEVWERGLAQAPAERALELLAAASPETSEDALAGLSIGQRDAQLLMLRESLFGPEMAAVIACPRCTEHLELTLETAELWSDSGQEPEGELALCVAGYDIHVRPPTTRDAIVAAAQRDEASSRRAILQRCVLSVQRGGASVTSDQLPPEVIEAVADQMTKADTLADIQIGISCPHCAHQWRSAFDIVSFLWSEIEAWVWRMLSEVHTLASAYGWCERDILALSPARRRFYLEVIGA